MSLEKILMSAIQPSELTQASLRIILRAFGLRELEKIFSLDPKGSVDERLLKIEDAKKNLEEALSAIEEMRLEAKTTQDNLSRLTSRDLSP